MSTYPLFFTFKQVVLCDNFRAVIEATGKALMVNEDDKWWLYGVQPGGMAAYGATSTEGLENYRTAFKNVLLDIADESKNEDDFRQRVRDFFSEIDKVDEEAWKTAREKLRSKKIQCPADLIKLRKEKSDPGCNIDIILIKKNARPTIKAENMLPDGDQYKCAA